MDGMNHYFREGIVTMLPPRNMYKEENNLPASPKSAHANLAGLFTVHVTCERDEILSQKYK